MRCWLCEWSAKFFQKFKGRLSSLCQVVKVFCDFLRKENIINIFAWRKAVEVKAVYWAALSTRNCMYLRQFEWHISLVYDSITSDIKFWKERSQVKYIHLSRCKLSIFVARYTLTQQRQRTMFFKKCCMFCSQNKKMKNVKAERSYLKLDTAPERKIYLCLKGMQ